MAVPINPELLIWARKRAGKSVGDLVAKFPKMAEWEAGTQHPTLGQLKKLAKALHVPFGKFFLPQPPDEVLPIADFRTVNSAEPRPPSPDLIDTLNDCLAAQDWYQDYANRAGLDPVGLVGSHTTRSAPRRVAAYLRTQLGFLVETQSRLKSYEEVQKTLIEAIEAQGILVQVNGVVGQNTQRPLNLEEFRGFALPDPLAPLIFVNGRDSKGAQMFTLIHELAHLVLGAGGVSNALQSWRGQAAATEIWCNRVAGEFLVPSDVLEETLQTVPAGDDLVEGVRRRFKVSKFVALLRLRDMERLDAEEFEDQWQHARDQAQRERSKPSGGGDYYRTSSTRNGKRLTRAVISDTLEGGTLYRHAYALLKLSDSSFKTQARKYGVM